MPKHYMPSEKILQVLFPKNFRKIPDFREKNRPEAGRSGFQPGPGAVNAAILRIYVHQNDVRPDFTDAVPGDAVVVAAGSQPHQFTGARHNQGADTALRNLHFHILDETQPLTRADADHFLALQLGNLCCHDTHSLIVLVHSMPGNGE